MCYGVKNYEVIQGEFNHPFIASSVNPDPLTHGRGYVARLSGSTAEMLSIWFIMMAGDKVFSYKNIETIKNIGGLYYVKYFY